MAFSHFFTYVVERLIGVRTLGLATPERIARAHLWENLLDSVSGTKAGFSLDQSAWVAGFLKNRFGFKNLLVDWRIILNKIEIASEQQLMATLESLIGADFDKLIYVIWENDDLPVIETTIEAMVASWDKMLALCERIWLFPLSAQYVIEVKRNQDIVIGVPPVDRTKVMRNV